MSSRIKADPKAKKTDGEVVKFEHSQYVAIKLKSDGKTYVEHKIFAKKLVDRKLADYDKDAKLEDPKTNFTVLATDSE